MKSLTIFVLSYVSLTLALPYRRNHNWFWDKDFKDNSHNDNDESREFFRSSTKKHNEATTTSRDYYTTEDTTIEPDYETTAEASVETDYESTTEASVETDYETTPEASVETDYETTPEASDEPDYEDDVNTSSSSKHSTSTVDPDYLATDITTEESDNDSNEENYLTTEATTVGSKSRVKAYYQQRKKQALTCKKNEHIKTQLDEFGNSDCQLCTCDGEGMLVCTSISCSDNGSDIKKQHEIMIHNSGQINLILREQATGCKPGTTVDAGQCSCSCVLPSVMSCPKKCYSNEDEDTSSNSRESKNTKDEEDTIETITEHNEDTVEEITTDNEVNVERITKNHEAKIDNTTEDDDDELKTEDDEIKLDKTNENTDVSSVKVVAVIEDKIARERKKESGKSRGPTKKYLYKHRL